MNFNLLEQFKKQMGLEVVSLPVMMEATKVQLYPSGVLKELVEQLLEVPEGMCLQVEYEALSNSNIGTLHQLCKMKGYKLHCLRNGSKRVLYVERRNDE